MAQLKCCIVNSELGIFSQINNEHEVETPHWEKCIKQWTDDSVQYCKQWTKNGIQ
jgi:hypothetical protein